MKSVLFVHDTQEDAGVRQHYLENVGFEVVRCDNGADCMTKLEERSFDLVLLDVLIKGINGFELCRSIREHHGAEELPILMGCSIYRQRIHREEAYAAGAQGYLLRPVDLEELVRDMRTLIGISQSLIASRETA